MKRRSRVSVGVGLATLEKRRFSLCVEKEFKLIHHSEVPLEKYLERCTLDDLFEIVCFGPLVECCGLIASWLNNNADRFDDFNFATAVEKCARVRAAPHFACMLQFTEDEVKAMDGAVQRFMLRQMGEIS